MITAGETITRIDDNALNVLPAGQRPLESAPPAFVKNYT